MRRHQNLKKSCKKKQLETIIQVACCRKFKVFMHVWKLHEVVGCSIKTCSYQKRQNFTMIKVKQIKLQNIKNESIILKIDFDEFNITEYRRILKKLLHM